MNATCQKRFRIEERKLEAMEYAMKQLTLENDKLKRELNHQQQLDQQQQQHQQPSHEQRRRECKFIFTLNLKKRHFLKKTEITQLLQLVCITHLRCSMFSSKLGSAQLVAE